MRKGVVELPYPVRVLGSPAVGVEEVRGVAAREAVERGPGFMVARALDGAVLLADLRGLVAPGQGEALGAVAGRVGTWARSLVQRFFVDSMVVCLEREPGRVLVLQAAGGRGAEAELGLEDLAAWAAGAARPGGVGGPRVGVGNVLPLDLLAGFAGAAGEWRVEVRARARRALTLHGWVVAGDDLMRVALGEVAGAPAGSLAAGGVLAFPAADGVAVVAFESLGVEQGVQLETAAQELTAVLGCSSAAVALPDGRGMVDVVMQLPIMHESGSFPLLGGGVVGRRVPYLGRNPLSFLADSPVTLL